MQQRPEGWTELWTLTLAFYGLRRPGLSFGWLSNCPSREGTSYSSQDGEGSRCAVWGEISQQKAKEGRQPLCHWEEGRGFILGHSGAQGCVSAVCTEPQSLPLHLAGH